MVYESMLLFAVLFISDWFFSTLLQQRHALQMRHAGQIWLFLVLGLYFIWFWTHGGQTLAMKTWRVRLVASDGQAVKARRAIARFLLAWLWILPGLVIASLMNAKAWELLLIPGANILLWALTAYLDPQRQFLHDRIVGTKVIKVLPADRN